MAIVVKGYKRSELPKLFRSAKVVVDWCMRGSERMPIEAVLNGALLLTSNCQSATDRRDYPLPPVGVVNSVKMKVYSTELVFNRLKIKNDVSTVTNDDKNINMGGFRGIFFVDTKAIVIINVQIHEFHNMNSNVSSFDNTRFLINGEEIPVKINKHT